MSINALPISRRTVSSDGMITSNGSYTLPRFAFIPHPSLQQLSTGTVQMPTPGGQSAFFAAPGNLQRPYPSPYMPAAYGVRHVQMKFSG